MSTVSGRRRRATQYTATIPMRPEGSGGVGASLSLPILDGVLRRTSSRRLASGPTTLGTRPLLNTRTGSWGMGRHARRSAATMLLGLALAGCAVGQNYKRSPVPVPERFYGDERAAEARSLAD